MEKLSGCTERHIQRDMLLRFVACPWLSLVAQRIWWTLAARQACLPSSWALALSERSYQLVGSGPACCWWSPLTPYSPAKRLGSFGSVNWGSSSCCCVTLTPSYLPMSWFSMPHNSQWSQLSISWYFGSNSPETTTCLWSSQGSSLETSWSWRSAPLLILASCLESWRSRAMALSRRLH